MSRPDRFPDNLDPDDFAQAWQIFCTLRDFENQFNALQTDYRKLASTWLLATFAGIGFVLSTDVNWAIDSYLVCALIGLAGGVGVWLLWSVDIMVYQQLLYAAFYWGVKLEERCTRLPPVRRTMMLTQIGGNVRYRLVWYYIIGVTIPWLISVAFLGLWGVAPAEPAPGGEARTLGLFALPVALLAIGSVARHQWTSSTTSIAQLERELRDHGLL